MKHKAKKLEFPFLEIQDLHARFRSHLGDLDALEHITFDVQRGEFLCLIGPSGCGKSTLLRIIAGLLKPSRGSIKIEGQPIRAPGRRVGLVFQQPTLLPWRTVRNNIALPMEMDGYTQTQIQQRTDDLLELVRLSGFEDEYPTNLSGGMAQRTAIARALAQAPELLLLDEPFGALDAITRERMAAELLRIWQKDQRTVVMVTHNVEEAALLADRVVVLSRRPGHVVDILTVNLPRPRTSSLIAHPDLQNIARQLRKRLCEGDREAPECQVTTQKIDGMQVSLRI